MPASFPNQVLTASTRSRRNLRRAQGHFNAIGLITLAAVIAGCSDPEDRDYGTMSAAAVVSSAPASSSAPAASSSAPSHASTSPGATSAPMPSQAAPSASVPGVPSASASSVASTVPSVVASQTASATAAAGSMDPVPSAVPSTNTSATPPADGPPNPSGYPEPGEAGQAAPTGAAGGLTVLPWAGYGGAISYSFDDANSSQINNESQMMGLGVPFTFYLQTGKSDAGNAFYQRALEAGHELANHTQSHGSGAADSDINQAQSFLMSKYSVTGYTMAAPNGNNSTYNSISAQLFILDRGVQDGVIGPDSSANMLDLKSYIPPAGAGTSQLNPKVDAAVSQGGWQTVCIHGFTGGSDGAYQAISLTGFVDHVTYAKTKNIWIGTMLDVGTYFLGRKLVKAATPTDMAGAKVYTWTLPTVFPPGKYVRVTIDGGTPSQDGKALPWNDHGFYEVALDAGTLTITP